MLTTKQGKSILQCRWGKPREKGHIMRVDSSVHDIVQRIDESDRRRWVSAVIRDAFRRRAFSPVLKPLLVMALGLSASVSLASVDSKSSRSALPARVDCTNCTATGWVSVVCPGCHGDGKIDNPRKKKLNANNLRLPDKVPCPKCVRGLSTPDKKGSGKIRRTCPICKGLKKVKNRP